MSHRERTSKVEMCLAQEAVASLLVFVVAAVVAVDLFVVVSVVMNLVVVVAGVVLVVVYFAKAWIVSSLVFLSIVGLLESTTVVEIGILAFAVVVALVVVVSVVVVCAFRRRYSERRRSLGS